MTAFPFPISVTIVSGKQCNRKETRESRLRFPDSFNPPPHSGLGVFHEGSGAWDGHRFICEDDFAADEGCLVYSFGISKDFSFEEAMAVRGKLI